MLKPEYPFNSQWNGIYFSFLCQHFIASACSCVPIHKEEITLRNYSCNYFQRFIKGARMTINCYYTKIQKDFILGIRNFSTSPSNYSNYNHMPSTIHTIYKSPYQINDLKPRYKLISFLWVRQCSQWLCLSSPMIITYFVSTSFLYWI